MEWIAAKKFFGETFSEKNSITLLLHKGFYCIKGLPLVVGKAGVGSRPGRGANKAQSVEGGIMTLEITQEQHEGLLEAIEDNDVEFYLKDQRLEDFDLSYQGEVVYEYERTHKPNPYYASQAFHIALQEEAQRNDTIALDEEEEEVEAPLTHEQFEKNQAAAKKAAAKTKIALIKYHRHITGDGLNASKAAVEAYYKQTQK
jgi:hypothetical protein